VLLRSLEQPPNNGKTRRTPFRPQRRPLRKCAIPNNPKRWRQLNWHIRHRHEVNDNPRTEWLLKGALTGPLSLTFGNRPDKAPRHRTYAAPHSTPGTASPLHSVAPFHPQRLGSASRFGSGRSVRPAITTPNPISKKSHSLPQPFKTSHSRGKREHIRAIPASAKSLATLRIIHSAQSLLHAFRLNSEPMVLHPIWMLTGMTPHPYLKQ
jgi:hypothetical protein